MEFKRECNNVYFILNNLEEQAKNKIPNEIFEFLENEKDEEYVVQIDLKKPIYEQELDSGTIELLSEIYQRYLCTSEEKIKYIREKNIEDFNTKYEDIFEKRKQLLRNNKEIENVNCKELVVNNNSIFMKIISWAKRLIKK